MGKDYRNSYNQDKKFRGKKPDKLKKVDGKKNKNSSSNEPIEIDFDNLNKFDGKRY